MDRLLGAEIVQAARARVGSPFRHHFKPVDLCERGLVTVDSCMERGLDGEEGYDCSGLVIASLADVLGISAQDWPREWRHALQLEPFAGDRKAVPGDILLFASGPLPDRPRRTHMGIYTIENLVIVHASGISGRVEEGPVEDSLREARVVPAAVLADVSRMAKNAM